MKSNILKIIFIGVIFASPTIFAQVIIGDATGTASNKASVLLEFANTNDKGIILPYVRTKAAAPTEGSIILDVSDATKARVKFYNANTKPNTNGWEDLSGQDADLSASSALSSQPTIAQAPESATAKTIIGASSTTIDDGVLVLESATKAMVLPQVDDVNKILNPSPGMMVYVNKTGAKRLAVFNGSKWSFWKP